MNPELNTAFLGLRPHDGDAVTWRDITAPEHFVQFYQDDETLVDAVGGFIGAGLSAGESAIIIATPEHRAAIEGRIRAAGLDPAAASARQQFFSLDAAKTLSQFMVDGQPDPASFFRVVGSLVARVSSNRSGLRAFGEMVALLWAEGNRHAAIRLEELWNELGREHRFSLFCAYPRRHFKGNAAAEPWLDVCKTHSRVIA